jgi:U6 snRNA-associated Sm-like protein LSm8
MTNLVRPTSIPSHIPHIWPLPFHVSKADSAQVLTQTVERIIRPSDDPEPSSQVEHGLYIVRGDNVSVVGMVDEPLDESIDWTQVRGEVIGSVKHSH